jgi:2-pyrone-4,6-dicarboxylate lactonase
MAAAIVIFTFTGPFDRFPAGSEGRFSVTRPFAIEDAFAIWDKLGITRGVIVHAVGSGEDNAVTYDALRRYPDRLRAVAILRPDVPDRRLDELTEAGFKAVRVTMIRQDGKPVSTLGTSYESSDLADAAAELEKLPLTYVIDHMSRTMADKGHDHPDFRAFTDRLKTGRYWTKISGADRNTRLGRPYSDTAPYLRAIVQAAPDQVVWGSDWPHVGHSAETVPDFQDLLRLLHECVPDEAIRRKILIDNPARLYNF